ncbi:MAG: dihydropteroate synthase [Clostridia bacterium]|nr:dihydropteroate synthase [Clostridia bacterium]MDE6211235.1 dihydropteroate synthase [Clostridia bacterium]
MKIGNRTFDSGTHVMAIINLTPDSFFAGSRTAVDELLTRVKNAIEDGAEVIDIGGQSTRPGHTPVSAQEEWQRLERPIDMIKTNFDIPLSVDTYYPYVAQKALEKGADMINDIWGLQYEDKGAMAEIIARHDASVCIMQNQNGISPDDRLWEDMYCFLQKSLDIATRAGIDKNKIILDGGIGFGKNKEQNFTVVNSYSNLHRFGYPLLLGTSRKSMFGGDVQDRLAPTLETTKQAVKQDVLFVRVHDVKENMQAIREAMSK